MPLSIGYLRSLSVIIGFAFGGSALTHGAEAERDSLVVDGVVRITKSELDTLLGNRLVALRAEEYRIISRTLDARVEARLLELEANDRRIGVEQLVEIEVNGKIAPVTESDIAAVLEASRERFEGQPSDEARSQIRDLLVKQRRISRRRDFVGALRSRGNVRVLVAPPRVTVGNAPGPAKGPTSAPVTIIEYSDFQCPFCSRGAATLRAVAAKYGDRVRIEFRHFPLPVHPDAAKAAEAAMCASEQGMFWEMHDSLFANQKAGFSRDSLKRYATDVGLDRAQFDTCVDSGRHSSDVEKSVEAATRAGVSSTPTFFINGRYESGALPLEPFSAIVDEELRAATSRTPASASR